MKKIIGFSLIFLFAVLLLSMPNETKAYSPIISQCTSNVNHQNSWENISDKPVMQLIDVRLDHYKLDGIAVRLYASSDNGKVKVGLRTRDERLLTNREISGIRRAPAWYYVDLTDVEIPRATYYVQAIGMEPEVYWNYTLEECLEDSYAVVGDDNQGFGKDMGFAVYAYDNSTASNSPAQEEPAADPGDPNPPTSSAVSNSDQVNNPDQPVSSDGSNVSAGSGSGSSSGSSAGNVNSSSPKGAKDTNKESKKAGNDSDTMIGVLYIGGLFFIVMLMALIFVLVMVRKKSEKKEEKAEN